MNTRTLPPISLAKLAPETASNPMAEHDGYAALYDVEIDRGFYMMELAQKCFSKSTGEPSKIVILNQHFSDQPIGKALKFDEQEKGLWMDFQINTEIQSGAEVDSNIRNGILSGISVGFDIIKVEIEKRGGEGAAGYEVDRVVEAKLRECSIVTFPAIDGARINNASDASNALTTFAVNDGAPRRERLAAGDSVMLATFLSRKRIRPQLAAGKYPAARQALENIINRV